MGIYTLEELDHIIPKDIIEKIRLHYPPVEPYTENFLGILRDILMIYDADAYFKKAWKKKFQAIEKPTVHFLLSYGIDINQYTKMYGLDICARAY